MRGSTIHAGTKAERPVSEMARHVVGQGVYALQSAVGLPISNLLIKPHTASNATVLDISMDSGLVLVDPSTGNMHTVSSPISQTLNTSLRGAGGIDTGTYFYGARVYYIFEIYNPVTQVLAPLASLDANSLDPHDLTGGPTLPDGYTYLRFIGIARSEGPITAGVFTQFVQYNCDVFFTPPLIPVGAFPSGTVTFDLSTYMPPNTIAPVGYFSVDVATWASGNVGITISAANAGDVWASTWSNGNAGTAGGGTPVKMPIVVSQTVYATKTGTGTGTVNIWLQGFKLNL